MPEVKVVNYQRFFHYDGTNAAELEAILPGSIQDDSGGTLTVSGCFTPHQVPPNTWLMIMGECVQSVMSEESFDEQYVVLS